MEAHGTVSQPGSQSAANPEAVIPAVRGEFYSYRAVFTADRPLGYLMKCRANKDRALTFAEDNPDGLDLVFVFGSHVAVCSPDSERAISLLAEIVDRRNLDHTAIAVAGITADEFQQLRERKNGDELAEACRAAITVESSPAEFLQIGMIIAVITESGKYGLLQVTELTSSAVKFDACHILL